MTRVLQSVRECRTLTNVPLRRAREWKGNGAPVLDEGLLARGRGSLLLTRGVVPSVTHQDPYETLHEDLSNPRAFGHKLPPSSTGVELQLPRFKVTAAVGTQGTLPPN